MYEAELLKLGQTLRDQAEFITNTSFIQGHCYSMDGDNGIYLFSQVEYNKFALVDLMTGNRLMDPVQIETQHRRDLGGLPVREALRKLAEICGSELIYHGTFRDYVLNEV